MAKKATTADCVKVINASKPGTWKRTCKRGSAGFPVREFQAIEHPGIKAIVREFYGKIDTLTFLETEYTGKPLVDEPHYFELDNSESFGPEVSAFWIVSKDFWDKNHHWDDQVGQHNTQLPKGFYEMMEACFEYDGTPEEGTKKLLAAGYLPLPKEKPKPKSNPSGFAFHCPLCGEKLEEVPKPELEEIDWSADWPKEKIDAILERNNAREANKSIEFICPKGCFQKDTALLAHHPVYGTQAAPGDSWSLSWIQ